MQLLSLRTLSILALVLGLFSSVSSFASIIPVTSLADTGAGSLREGVATANAGDTLDVQVNGTILLDSQLIIAADLNIFGPGTDLLVLDGQDKNRILLINDTVTLRIRSMSFTNGNASGYFPLSSGGVISSRGRVEASECLFYENKGTSGGAIFLDGGNGFQTSALLTNCTFHHNRAIIVNENGLPNTGGALGGNSRGGGLAIVEATNCTFSQNVSARSGGAIYLVADPSGGARLTCDHCTITENEAPRVAGGIDHSEAEKLVISNSIISGNIGPADAEDMLGGVISQGYNIIGNGALGFTPEATDIMTTAPELGPLGDHGSPLLTHGMLCGSPAIDAANPATTILLDLRGAARLGIPDIGAHEWNPDLDLRVLTLANEGGNSLREVTIIACDGDTIDLSQLSGSIGLTSPITLDKKLVWTGNQNASLSLDGGDSTRLLEIGASGDLEASWLNFRNARAQSLGGGAIQNRGTLTLANCAIIRSVADAGGAIANYGTDGPASVTLTNCTLSGNVASSLSGGALDNRSFDFPASASLINCTVANNSALFQGGGLFNKNAANSTFSLWNTLVANNQCESGPDAFGEFVSSGHNLIGSDDGLTSSFQATDILNTSAELDPLSREGWSTYVHRLQATSPAIDAGDNAVELPFDQRGFQRVFNGTIDIGAFEYDPANSLSSVESLSLTLYPNPSKGKITLLGHTEGKGILTLVDLSGKSYKHEILFRSQATETIDLKTLFKGLHAGLYLLSLQQGNQAFRTKVVLR